MNAGIVLSLAKSQVLSGARTINLYASTTSLKGFVQVSRKCQRVAVFFINEFTLLFISPAPSQLSLHYLPYSNIYFICNIFITNIISGAEVVYSSWDVHMVNFRD